MGNIASGHFKPTNNIQEKHNDRTLSPSYLLPEEFRGQNEVNLTSAQARQLKERIIENAKKNYLITFKQKFQAKSYLWSLVVNTKADTTMSDLEKLAEHFDLKYGFQCYQIAIHRDEGYIDENNQPHTNHHAHMEFVTLGKENGKNMMGRISPVKLRQIQTEIAQILGMERGISGNERIEPRKYAQMKNKERKALNTLKQEKVDLINEIIKEAAERNPTNFSNELLERFRTKRFVITKQRTIAFNDFEVPVFQDNKKIATRQHYEAVEIPLNDDVMEAIKEAKTKQKALLDHKILNDKINRDASVIISKSPKDLISAFPNNNEETIRLAQVFSFVFKHSLILDWNKDTSTLSSNTNARLKEAFSKVFGLDLETLELNFFKQDTTQNGEISATFLEEPNLKGKLIGTNKEISIPIEQSFLKVEIYRALNQRKSQPPKSADELVQILLKNALNQTNIGFTAQKTAENEKKKENQIPPKNANELVQILLKNALKWFFDSIKKLYNELQAKDKELNNLKQDKTTLTNKLQEQATETQKAQDRIKTLESNENTLKNDLNAKESTIQAKDKELNTLKQQKTTLESKLQDKDKTINELNQFKNSSNLALDLEKAQDRIKTLESNENTLKNDLNAKESTIQAKDKELQDKETTINELKKQKEALEYNYNQERERMKAENKRLQEQGLEKIYTQKDYENLKRQHADEIEALKNKIQEQDKTIKKNNKYKIQAQHARYRQSQQSIAKRM